MCVFVVNDVELGRSLQGFEEKPSLQEGKAAHCTRWYLDCPSGSKLYYQRVIAQGATWDVSNELGYIILSSGVAISSGSANNLRQLRHRKHAHIVEWGI